jgi:tetratricopeptide (TPR) repeat protein
MRRRSKRPAPRKSAADAGQFRWDIEKSHALEKAKEYYDKGREKDALAIVDRLLDLPAGIDSAVKKVRSMLNAEFHNDLPFRIEHRGGAIDLVMTDPSKKLQRMLVCVMLEVRGKCFSALLDNPNQRDAELIARALENAEIMIAVFPEDSIFHTLAAEVYFCTQVFFPSGNLKTAMRQTAMRLVRKAMELDPSNLAVKGIYELIRKNMATEQGSEPELMTAQALEILFKLLLVPPDSEERFAIGTLSAEQNAALSEACHLLEESLNIKSTQPEAWAGLAWLTYSLGCPKEGRKHLEKARALDPNNELLRSIEGGLRAANLL